MSLPPPSVVPGSGLVRLLNTAGGRVLCLAGDVDDRSVDSFLRRYGREPMPVDGIDAGSVTRLSLPALDLVLDHLDAADRAGRRVRVRRSPHVEALLAGGRSARGTSPVRVITGMATDDLPPSEPAGTTPAAEETAPPLPEDPRVPRIEDADPTHSKELGGAAPAVGPKT
jgi:hypothetical protein